MKKLYISIIFLLFLSGCTSEVTQNSKVEIKTENQTVTAVVSSTTNIKINDDFDDIKTEIFVTTNTPTNSEKTFLVTRVIDGDTIEIEGGQKVRYIGIDTPETVDPRKPVQCFGKEASAKNKELVEGKKVRLEKDVTDTDKYGRLLRYVYIGDIFVNLELVKQGYASSYSYPPDIKFQNIFLQAQQEAQAKDLGFWSACEENNIPEISTPSINTTTNNNSPTDCKIKGNISSKEEKIYHSIGCDSYDLTKIDEARGERWFCTEEEAVNAGWRKALNCP